jgi:hypothetical protein
MIALLLVVCGGVAPEILDSDVSSGNGSTRHGGSFIVKIELLFVLFSFITDTAWK